MEIAERQKNHLTSLLKVKKAIVNSPKAQSVLQSEIITSVAPMSNEDVAWCEKIVGINAL